MFISDFAIRRPIITLVSMLALVIFGVAALLMLKTDEFPDVQPPVVAVSILYPGGAPENVEREIIEPVEDVVAGISGVKKIQSSGMDSFALLIVEFVYEKNLQEASQQIRDEINAIRDKLPTEMKEPVLTRFDPADMPIVSLTLSSNKRSPAEMTLLADPGITRQLRSVPGVAQVQVVGGIKRELTVEMQPRALQGTGVSIAQIVGAVQAQNLAAPVGRLTGPLDERSIRLLGRIENPADFGRLIVAQQPGGGLVRLGDVATVRDGTEEPRTAAVFNGADAVGIDIIKSRGYSTTSVARDVLAHLGDVEKTLPKDVQLRVVRDAGDRVSRSVRDVQATLIEGALLTVLVVFLFLNSWRSTVITGVALPISVLASFVAVWAWGFTLNTMSLLGLSLAIGILIDDAIVVRENIVRHVEMGRDHYTAAQEGTSEIGLAVAATTFSIVVVFVPVAFMGGVAQQWFAPFALTIACSVLVSLFVSFSLDPMLSAYWPDPHRPMHERSFISRALGRFNDWFNRQADRYRGVIGWALDHRWSMVALGTAIFLAAVALPALGILGGSFFPIQDVSEFSVVIDTPPGSNLAYTKLKAEEVARLARSKPEVAYTYTSVGGAGGAFGGQSVDSANVYVRLKPRAERVRHQEEISQELRREVQHIGGVSAWISNDTFGNQKQIQVQLRGPDLQRLNQLAEQVKGVLQKVPGAVDLGLSTKGQQPELAVEMDRPLAGSVGITVGQVAQSLRPAFAGIEAGNWVDPMGKTRDVTIRLVPQARTNTADLESLPLIVPGPKGPITVPLGQIASIRRGLGPAKVDHLDRERVITVQANTENRPLSEVMRDFNARMQSFAMPAGYQMSQGGETQDSQEVFGRILMALGIAIVLMYLVLVVQFGSFLDPMAILLSLPLSLIGVVLALLVTGSTLNIMSMIGVILLMGIVAKNAILLIDFAKWSEANGMDRRTAIIEAGRVRLRPILMTTFALIAGMVPVALGHGEGGDFRAPLGRAVIGGVLTSTLLTLLVIPTVYEILSDWRDWGMAKLRPAAAKAAVHVGEQAQPERRRVA